MIGPVTATQSSGVGAVERRGEESEAAPSPRGRRQPEIQELAEKRLRSNPYLALRNISCEFAEGVLTLRGILPTYYLRQIAQSAVAGMDGVRAVVDCIEVISAPAREGRSDIRSRY